MPRALSAIDRNLDSCAIKLGRLHPVAEAAARQQVLTLVDDLLDERLQLTGPPRISVEGNVKPTRTCAGCGLVNESRWVPPVVEGGVGVWFTECPSCDYRLCHAPVLGGKCGERIHDRRATHCSRRHDLGIDWSERQQRRSA